MSARLQSLLLRLYARFGDSALLRSRAGRWALHTGYALYKRFLEVGDIRMLAELITPATHVVDVGANVGFLTFQFAHWVRDGGKVIAIEPEPVNHARLMRERTRKGLQDTVIAIEGVAAEVTGRLRLAVNRSHPGDHKIAEEGVEVASYRLDDLVPHHAEGKSVSLIKIDVQGAEERVLSGAWGVIDRDRPALLIEIDDRGLRSFGSSAARVLDLMGEHEYRPYRLERGRIVPAGSRATLLPLCSDGSYLDLLFLAEAG